MNYKNRLYRMTAGFLIGKDNLCSSKVDSTISRSAVFTAFLMYKKHLFFFILSLKMNLNCDMISPVVSPDGKRGKTWIAKEQSNRALSHSSCDDISQGS